MFLKLPGTTLDKLFPAKFKRRSSRRASEKFGIEVSLQLLKTLRSQKMIRFEIFNLFKVVWTLRVHENERSKPWR